MRVITLALGLGAAVALSVGPTVLACPGDDHSHEHSDARRAEPQVPISPPSRPLVWGDVNIIHTTDSHGWLLGHQKSSFPEPNYRYVCIMWAGTQLTPSAYHLCKQWGLWRFCLLRGAHEGTRNCAPRVFLLVCL